MCSQELNITTLDREFLRARALSVDFAENRENRAPICVNVHSPPNAAQNALVTQYVRIRPLRIEDVPSLFAAAIESIAQLCQWMTWPTMNYSMQECHAFVLRSINAWEQGEYYTFAIIDVRDGSLLGSIGLNHLNHIHKFANVGYWVRKTRTRSGVASAAALATARFGFGALRLNRLEFLVPTDNVPSQRVAQRAGARFEGVLRNRLVLSGMAHDAAVYSLVPGDLPPQAQPV